MNWTYEGAMRRWREIEIPAPEPAAMVFHPYWPFPVADIPAPPTVERVYQRLLWTRSDGYQWTTVPADTYYHG